MARAAGISQAICRAFMLMTTSSALASIHRLDHFAIVLLLDLTLTFKVGVISPSFCVNGRPIRVRRRGCKRGNCEEIAQDSSRGLKIDTPSVDIDGL
jgi:hypothetical protein